MSVITVLLVDDHALLREALKQLLDHNPAFSVVGEADNGEEAVSLTRALRPQVVILDLNLRGANGMEVIEQILEQDTGTRVLVLSLHTQWPLARQALRRGAMGYVTKSSHWWELTEALSQLAAGYRYLCRELRSQLNGNDEGEPKGVNALTPREVEIIQLVKRGASSREIAERLQVSKKTVESHRYHILKKLGLNCTAALVAFIHSHGLEGYSAE